MKSKFRRGLEGAEKLIQATNIINEYTERNLLIESTIFAKNYELF